MTLRALLLLALPAFSLAGAVLAVLAWSRRRWRDATAALRARLASGAVDRTPQPEDVFLAPSAVLPDPVRRYLGTVLPEGERRIVAATFQHRGEFDLGRARPRWRPFTSSQRVVVRRPGFDWDARIAALPGLPVYVHDAYALGEGFLEARLAGLVPLARPEPTRDLATGELQRFLAETAWYPTALLPGEGVRWEAVTTSGERRPRARAVLRDRDHEVAVELCFGADGLIASVEALRPRLVDGRSVPTPWRGRFWGYAVRDGVRVPLDAEVEWLLPDGPRPYWRGHLLAIEYEWDAARTRPSRQGANGRLTLAS